MDLPLGDEGNLLHREPSIDCKRVLRLHCVNGYRGGSIAHQTSDGRTTVNDVTSMPASGYCYAGALPQTPEFFALHLRAPLSVSFRSPEFYRKKERYRTVSPLGDQPALESHSCVALSSVAGEARVPL